MSFVRLELAAARRLTAACTAVALGVGLVAPGVSTVAAPVEHALDRPAAAPAKRATFPGGSVSIESSRAAIPVGGEFGLTARVRLSKPARFVRVRLQLRRPTGRLIYQRTQLFTAPDEGVIAAPFARTTADVGMPADAYPYDVIVEVGRGDAVTRAVVSDDLLVYDPSSPPVPLVLALRVSGPPLTDPQGRFVDDPGRFTRTRDEVDAVATWVLSSPDARVSLAVSPVLLEEWKQISQGFELVGPEGATEVAADTPVAVAYGATLTKLRSAIDTGRLELVATGFSDPDLAELVRHDLAADVAEQYRRGLSAQFAALETTPSTGTIPAYGSVPEAAFVPLAAQDVAYTVVDARFARTGETTAAPGAYSVKSGPRALVADPALADSFEQTSTTASVRLALKANSSGSAGPLVLLADLGPSGTTLGRVAAHAGALYRLPWVRPRLAREVMAARPAHRVTMTRRAHAKPEPRGYWDEVSQARESAEALAFALGENSREAARAADGGLIAESAAWAGANGKWALADRGRIAAAEANRIAASVFDPISLRVEPVTLSGDKGTVPVTITNDSDRTLKMRVSTKTDGRIKSTGAALTDVVVQPKDNFAEIPVDMLGVLEGKLTVKVLAGPATIEQDVVAVRASYMDRIAIVLGIVFALGVLLVFIIRRVRSRLDVVNAETVDEGYTEHSPESDRRS
jgi:hypothetical protein